MKVGRRWGAVYLQVCPEARISPGDFQGERFIPGSVLWSGLEGGSRMLYKLPLVLSPQPEGGFTVTSPLLPELVTEGDTVSEALANVQDALAAVIETYQDLGRPLPASSRLPDEDSPVWLETLIVA